MTGWLIFIACVLIVVVLFQVTRTMDLIGQLRGEENKTMESTSKFNGVLLIIFLVLGLIGFFWCFGYFKNTNLPPSSSEHGILIERMTFITTIVCSIVFLICNILLFLFAYLYRYRQNRQAVHFAHSNKLEFIWTIIPTIVLTGLVVFGLQSWTKIMSRPNADSMIIEVTGQQFFWTSRYPGADGKLGPRDYNLICADNPLGIVTREYVEHRINLLAGNKDLNLKGEINELKERKEKLPPLIDSVKQLMDLRPNRYMKKDLEKKLDALKEEYDNIDGHITTRELNLERIKNKYTEDYYMANAAEMTWGYDDILPSEIHLPVSKEVEVKITAMDVLHNFYVPHMKIKMDAVPGMPTSFKFTPITTTKEMREIYSKNPLWQKPMPGETEPKWKNFNYEVACAELCGVGHSSMKYTMVIETEPEYEAWLANQKPYWNGTVSNLKISKLSEYAPKIPVQDTTKNASANADTGKIKTDTMQKVQRIAKH